MERHVRCLNYVEAKSWSVLITTILLAYRFNFEHFASKGDFVKCTVNSFEKLKHFHWCPFCRPGSKPNEVRKQDRAILD